MTKKSFDTIVSAIAKYLFCIVFVLGMVYFLFYVLRNNGTGVIPGNVRYLKEWEVSYNAMSGQKVTLPVKLDVEKGVPVAYECILPEYIPEGTWLAIQNSKDVIIKIDGKERFAWNSDSVKVPGGAVKSIFMYVQLYTNDCNSKLTLIKRSADNNGVMPNVIIGDSLAVTVELLRQSGISTFGISFAMFALSVMLVLCGLFLKKIFEQEIHLVSIGMAIMCVSAWLVMDSNVFQLAFNTRYVDGVLSYILTLIMVFPFMIYIDGLQSHRYQRVYSILMLLEFLNAATCCTLHFCGIMNFYELLLPMDAIIAWIVVIVLGCTLIDVMSGQANRYHYVAYGLMIFMLLAIIEIVILNNENLERVDGVFILFGLFVLIVAAIAQQFYDIKIIENEKAVVIESDKARNDFLANMSHEFRTPINSILGMNEMILQENQDESIREYAKRIERSGKVLLDMVEDILDFSKLQNDQYEAVYEDYNVRRLIDHVADGLKEYAAYKNLGVNFGITGDLPTYLKGDEWYISRVLESLISNAVKYTENGSVTFAVECIKVEDRYSLEFTIKDTGIGIREEDMENLFKPFVRGDLRRNRAIEGAGLGLAITKRLVDTMEGEIKVESVYQEGTTITVKLPQYKAVEAHEDAEEARPDSKGLRLWDVIEHGKSLEKASVAYEEPSAHHCSDNIPQINDLDIAYIAPKARVLAVDDNSANIVVVRELLKKTKVIFDSASSGTEAIEKCNNNKYDIILMDHMMPEPDGIETMHIIRSSLESLNRHTKIIVLTANAVGDCKERYIKEGFDNYMSKPVDREILLKMVRYYLPAEIIEEVEAESTADDTATQPSVTDTLATEADNDIINVSAMLKRFENNQDVANMILGECVKEGNKKIVLLRELFESGDIARYAVEAHGVKGVMASVCANDFSAHAKAHEFAGKEMRVDFIRDDIDSFLEEYRKVLDYITDYLGKQGISVEKTRVIERAENEERSVEQFVDEIEEALDDFDVDKALRLIDGLEGIADKEIIGTIEEVRQFADDFEYDLAKEALHKLK